MVPPALHSLAIKALLFQFQETLPPSSARALVVSLRGEATGNGEAGPGAGGQQHPDQSGCGPMGSSPLLLGETSLVSMMLGPLCVGGVGSLHPSLASGQPCHAWWCEWYLLPVNELLTLGSGWRWAHLDTVTAWPPLSWQAARGQSSGRP